MKKNIVRFQRRSLSEIAGIGIVFLGLFLFMVYQGQMTNDFDAHLWLIFYGLAFGGVLFFLSESDHGSLNQYSQSEPRMNAFSTYSDMQVIFIPESKKVLIECSESLVERYGLRQYVYVISEEEYRHCVHPQDTAEALVYSSELNQGHNHMKEVQFRFKFPEMDNHIHMFRKGYYALETGIGYLAFDITNTAYMKEKMKEKDALYHSLIIEREKVMDKSKDLIFKLDHHGNIIYASKAAIEAYGLDADQAEGKNILDMNERFGNKDHSWFERVLSEGSSQNKNTIMCKNQARHVIWNYELIRDPKDNVSGILAIGHEITHLINIDKHLEHERNHDHLTGLLNQQGLYEALEEAGPLKKAVAFFIDLKAFSQVNNYYGHTIGDLLLKTIAKELTALCEKNCLVSRFSGDEFVALAFNEGAKDKNIRKMKDRLEAFMDATHQTDEVSIQVKKNIGYAVYPDDTDNLKRIVSLSSLAMKECEKESASSIKRYEAKMSENLRNNVIIAAKLRSAIEDEAIEIHFQHVMNVNTKGIEYLEGLARWTDAELGDIGPETFIGIAQKSNLIDRLDRYLVQKALAGFSRLKEDPYYLDTRLSLNIAPESVLNVNFVRFLEKERKKHAIASDDVCIEISEGTFVNNFDHCVERIDHYKKLGYQIALDDFGKDYSSLAVLENVQFDIIKIDALFTRNIHMVKNQEIIKMVRKITSLSKKELIIEGVETKQQKEMLATLDCFLQQGFLFHRPAAFQ